MVKMTKQFSNPPFNMGSGAFMGFESDESESETEDIEKGVRQMSEVILLLSLCSLNNCIFY